MVYGPFIVTRAMLIFSRSIIIAVWTHKMFVLRVQNSRRLPQRNVSSMRIPLFDDRLLNRHAWRWVVRENECFSRTLWWIFTTHADGFFNECKMIELMNYDRRTSFLIFISNKWASVGVLGQQSFCISKLVGSWCQQSWCQQKSTTGWRLSKCSNKRFVFCE